MTKKKPGTQRPAESSAWEWAALNPCPLNACCDVYGNCGINPEFCTNTTSPGGAPGSKRNNTNGCISHCGTEIDYTTQPETAAGDSKKRIAYFHAGYMDGQYNNMDISKVVLNGDYTHVHWAFANITDEFKVDISGQQEQFDGLVKLSGIKRIVSLGGWGFSTDQQTRRILREGVRDGNRQILASEVATWVKDNDLDGVHIDWEYPGAQDIPGIEPDSPDSGRDYAEFLRLLRQELPDDKSLSIGIPASFEYLKGFDPLTQYEPYVDYYVLMAYDLHGEWDYRTLPSNVSTDESRLWSHVNETETWYALAMVTKAGIPAGKVIGGLALYGRVFNMTAIDEQMRDELTTGRGGGGQGPLNWTYIHEVGFITNAQVHYLLSWASDHGSRGNRTVPQFYDQGDFLIWGDQAVSWMAPETQLRRRLRYDSSGLGGSADWAVNLNRTYKYDGKGDLVVSGDDSGPSLGDCLIAEYPDLKTVILGEEGGWVRPHCKVIMVLKALNNTMTKAHDNYTAVDNGYDGYYGYYVEYIKKMIPATLDNEIMWNRSLPAQYNGIPAMGPGWQYFDCKYPTGTAFYPCSTTISEMALRPASIGSEIEMRLRDPDGLYGVLANRSVLPEWIDFGEHSMTVDVVEEGEGQKPHAGQVLHRKLFFRGWPIRNDSMVVKNPKTMAQQGVQNIPALRNDIEGTILDIVGGTWTGGEYSDAAQAYAPQVFLLQQAIDHMATAKDIGTQEEKEDEEEERKRKENLIIAIISAALMFVPVIGAEAADALGFLQLGRIIAVSGEIGNDAMALYDTVKDPDSAAINMIGMMMGVGQLTKATRDGKGLGGVAAVRKGMSAKEIASMGKVYEREDSKLQRLFGGRCS